jgi:hypothetical protein
MQTDLERRRLAIADALRDIMAEPLPPPVTHVSPVAPVSLVASALRPSADLRAARRPEPESDAEIAAAPTRENHPRPEPEAAVEAEPAPARLTAVPEVEVEVEAEVEPEPDAEGTLAPDVTIDLDAEPDRKDGDVVGGDSPAVPPLESVGSMSRVASLALFGHA